MKSSRIANFGLIALVMGALGGCATTSTAPPEANWDIGSRPQILMPGAVRSEVKGLAMGAARSKGWTIVKSTDDRLVVQRPVEPGSPAASATGPSVTPPVIEVTSAFIQRSDGVLVGLGAELVSQPTAAKPPKRVDYTETYRDALNRSLESLRSNWAANRQRVASATPSEAVRAEAAAERADAGQGSANPLVQVWADALEEEKASKSGSTGSTLGSAPAAQTQPRSGTQPGRSSASQQPAPRQADPPPAAPIAPQTAAAPIAPAAPMRGTGPAPVVEGNLALRGGTPSPEPLGVTGIQLPTATVETTPRDQNMLVLNQGSGTGTWAYYAEQYARLRGCDVGADGASVIESRADSEILKVPCRSSDSFLVKCQNGVCRGLE